MIYVFFYKSRADKDKTKEKGDNMTISEIAEAMVNNETVLLIDEEDEIPCKIEAIYKSGSIYIKIKNIRIQDDYNINDFKRKIK